MLTASIILVALLGSSAVGIGVWYAVTNPIGNLLTGGGMVLIELGGVLLKMCAEAMSAK